MTPPVEPVMHVVIIVPQEYAARVAVRIPRHRGRFQSSEHRDGVQTIRAHVPQAEAGAFVSAVLAETNNQARTSMALAEYWPASERPPGDPAVGVREPRPNVPIVRGGAIAVPEPPPDPDDESGW